MLRLEPVAAMLHREAKTASEMPSGAVAAGDLMAISIRDANLDDEAFVENLVGMVAGAVATGWPG